MFFLKMATLFYKITINRNDCPKKPHTIPVLKILSLVFSGQGSSSNEARRVRSGQPRNDHKANSQSFNGRGEGKPRYDNKRDRYSHSQNNYSDTSHQGRRGENAQRRHQASRYGTRHEDSPEDTTRSYYTANYDPSQSKRNKEKQNQADHFDFKSKKADETGLYYTSNYDPAVDLKSEADFECSRRVVPAKSGQCSSAVASLGSKREFTPSVPKTSFEMSEFAEFTGQQKYSAHDLEFKDEDEEVLGGTAEGVSVTTKSRRVNTGGKLKSETRENHTSVDEPLNVEICADDGAMQPREHQANKTARRIHKKNKAPAGGSEQEIFDAEMQRENPKNRTLYDPTNPIPMKSVAAQSVTQETSPKVPGGLNVAANLVFNRQTPPGRCLYDPNTDLMQSQQVLTAAGPAGVEQNVVRIEQPVNNSANANHSAAGKPTAHILPIPSSTATTPTSTANVGATPDVSMLNSQQMAMFQYMLSQPHDVPGFARMFADMYEAFQNANRPSLQQHFQSHQPQSNPNVATEAQGIPAQQQPLPIFDPSLNFEQPPPSVPSIVPPNQPPPATFTQYNSIPATSSSQGSTDVTSLPPNTQMTSASQHQPSRTDDVSLSRRTHAYQRQPQQLDLHLLPQVSVQFHFYIFLKYERKLD